MRRRFFVDVAPVEWKTDGVFTFLRNDDRLNTMESGDLPVNVQHLRFKKRRAVKCDDGTRFRRVQRLDSNIKPGRANSKVNRQKLNPLPLSSFFRSRKTLSSARPY